MKRTARILAGAAAVVAVAVAAGVVVVSGSDDTTASVGQPAVTTVAVTRGPLSDLVSQAGILTYRAGADSLPLPVINRASGTYTTLPAGGAEVHCGEVLYRVDGRPVLLLCGTVPAYRDLHPGDTGEDVRQLNANLHHGDGDAASAVDPESVTFTAGTEAALQALQLAQGLEPTGVLGLADAVFLPWSLRVANVTAVLGATAQPGEPVLQATSDTLEVHVELDSTQQAAVHPGDVARITLPGNVAVAGKVERLGRIAQIPTGEDGDVGDATVGAYLSLDDPSAASGLDRAPVQVEITTDGVDDALSVPVTAIVGRAGGGFAVEVIGDRGRRRLVAVDLGLFDSASGRVQVDGDVRAGDRVVVPSL